MHKPYSIEKRNIQIEQSTLPSEPRVVVTGSPWWKKPVIDVRGLGEEVNDFLTTAYNRNLEPKPCRWCEEGSVMTSFM